jgi:ComF family protein
VIYNDASRPLILGFKHGDRLHIAPLFVGWMRLAGAEILESAGVLVPVPLHPRRLIARRYNQSAVLARGIAAATGHAVSDRALRRVKPTPSQGRMTANQRARNVAGAFDIDVKRRHEIADRDIVLIDDVRTSGATVNACTRVLIRAGARSVSVLTIARVP